MSSAKLLVTATLKSATGVPENDVVNSFAFSCGGAGSIEDDAGECIASVGQFFTVVQSTSQSVDTWLGPQISRDTGVHILRAYDITGKLAKDPGNGKVPPHGSPIFEAPMTLAAGFGGEPGLPEEVAIVLTLRANEWDVQPVESADGSDLGSATDRPRQRYTGRIFIGPLTRNSLAMVDSRCRPAPGLRDTLLDAAEDLQANANANGHNWGVWSRQDGSIRNVELVQVDNAWDTQRRRGPDATVRTSRSI